VRSTVASPAPRLGPPLPARIEPSERPGETIFVGREAELRLLREAVERAIAGRGRLVLLTGDPGMGKTFLAEQVVAYAESRGAQVVWGRCYEGEGAPAFWPWVQVLRSAVRSLDGAAQRATLGAADLAHIVLEAGGGLPPVSPPLDRDSAQARFRLFDSVARILESWTLQKPVVAVIDDLQGNDHSSLRLLEFIAREVHSMALLLVVVYRDGAVTADQPLAEMAAELLRAIGTERLPLTGLSEAEVGRFIESTQGRRPAPELVSALHRRTEGNPLFVSEFVSMLCAEGRAAMPDTPAGLDAIRVPESIAAVIDRRLAAVPRRCRDLLGMASVIGREFDLQALEGVAASMSPAPCESGAADARGYAVALHESLAACLIVKLPDAARRYRFTHALIRETLYGRLGSKRRATLHRLVGEALERTPDPRQHLSELARHYYEAERDGEGHKAVTYARDAADRAAVLLAYEEAARLYQLALQALERTRQSLDTGAAALRCRLLLALGGVQARAGDHTAARETFWQAAALAQQRGMREMVAQAALGVAEVGVGLPFGAVDPSLVGLLEGALEALGDEQSVLRVRLMGRLATEIYYGESHGRRAALARAAVAMARRIDEPRTLAAALGAQHCALWEPSNGAERVALATEMIALAQSAGDTELRAQGRTWHIIDLLELGCGQALDREIALLSREAHDLRQPRYLWLARHFMAVRALSRGGFAASERLAEEAAAHAAGANVRGAAAVFTTHMFALRTAQGRLDEFADVIGALVERFRPAWEFNTRCGLVYINSELGRAAAARPEFEQLVAQLASESPNHSWLTAVACLARVCAFLADAARAPTLYELMLPFRGRAVAIGHPATFYDGSVSYYLGILATVMGRWDTAAQHFEDALRREADMSARPHLARVQYEYAAMLARRAAPGDVGRAFVLLDQALSAARELGMQSLEQKVLAVHAALGTQESKIQIDERAVTACGATDVSRHPGIAETCSLSKQGDYWIVSDRGCVAHLKDSKGLRYIIQLLRHPGHEFHVLDLVHEAPPVERSLGYRPTGWHDQHVHTDVATSLLDARAKAAYRRRIEELRAELADAEHNRDAGRTARVRAEIDFIGEELAAAVGLGGRNRIAADNAQRARSAVTKRIKDAIAKVHGANPRLGHHLTTTIKTGLYCVYAASPGQSIRVDVTMTDGYRRELVEDLDRTAG
jgi:tetratricopeptide (TPR) repeat protein